MSLKLYEISSKYRNILSQIEEADGEITEDMLSPLMELEESIEKKSSNIAKFIKNLEAEYVAVSEAQKNMKDRADRINSKIVNLKNYLKFNLEKSGIKCINSDPNFVISLKNCPPKVIIKDSEGYIIPPDYLRIKTLSEPNKELIKEKLLNGEQLEFATLEHSTRLEIK